MESESFISFFWDEPSEIPDINLASSYTHEWQVNVRVEGRGRNERHVGVAGLQRSRLCTYIMRFVDFL